MESHGRVDSDRHLQRETIGNKNTREEKGGKRTRGQGQHSKLAIASGAVMHGEECEKIKTSHTQKKTEGGEVRGKRTDYSGIHFACGA